jgi:hypothetical protein
MITAPGLDGLLSDNENDIQDILEKIDLSKNGHDTNKIFIVGHYDCLANPVDDETHNKQVVDSVERVKESYFNYDVIGLWVDSTFNVKVIYKL